MFPIRATFLELAGESQAAAPGPCEKRLQERFLNLRNARARASGADVGEPSRPGGETYEVRFVFEPKAWGASAKHAPAVIRIAKDPARMAHELSREVESAFVFGNWALVDRLAAGIFGLDRFSDLREFGPSGRLSGGKSGTALLEVLEDHVDEERRPLWDAFREVRAALVARAIETEKLIQAYAACRAAEEELPACDAATLDEARRYLSLADRADRAVRLAVTPTPQLTQSLTGPDGRALAAAIRSLAGPLRGFRAAQERLERLRPPTATENVKGAVWMAMLGPLAFPVQARRAIRQARHLLSDGSELAAAGAELARRSQEFQEAFAGAAAGFPILFKIADHVDESEAAITRRIVEALHDALVASAELAALLREEPETAWRFPGLIDRTVERGFAEDRPFAQRVAANRMLKENDTPPFARLNAGIQLLDSTLMLVPSPHVKLAMVIATIIGDAAELLESYLRTREQRLGFRASLNPSRSLGPDGSYAGLLLQAAFLGIGLLPVKGAVRDWVEEGAKGAKARKAAALAAG